MASQAVHDVAQAILGRPRVKHAFVVAIDGVDGVGKTTFADQLAAALHERGVTVHRASIDDFHHPRAHRYRRGRRDPVGYLEDSFDHATFARLVLDPLQPGGAGRIRLRHHDLVSDAFLDEPLVTVAPQDVVVVDGVFLQSSALADRWDLTVFLDAPFEVTVRRAIDRDESESRHARDAAELLARERYVPGQRLYLERHDPIGRADIVVDATDPQCARVRRRREQPGP